MNDTEHTIGEARPQPDFLNEHELLRRLPISRRTIYQWRTAGRLPFIKTDRRVFYHWPSVSEALLRLQKGGRL